jgi:phosphatidylglycerophosphatase C
MTAGCACPNSTSVQHRIAIYDLDRTVLQRPTFTPFLLFAARRRAPWRLLALPLWLLAMLGHALKFYDREQLKPFGIALFLGRHIPNPAMQTLAQAFAATVIPGDIQCGAAAMMERDRRAGYRLVLATAAPEFYALHLGEKMGFEAVLATRHKRSVTGGWYAQIDGQNCYAAEKRRRIEQWLMEQNLDHSQTDILFYSDDLSDSPSLKFATTGFAVNPNARFAAAAHNAGWRIMDFQNPNPMGEKP